MNQKDKYTDMPLISKITEHDEKNGQSVMKSVFKEISFRSNENVSEEATEVLTELSYIKYFHFLGRIRNERRHFSQRKR